LKSLRVVQLVLLLLLAAVAGIILFGPDLKDHVKDIEEALQAGKKADWWDDAAIGIRYAAWINVLLLSLLLATSKWWCSPFVSKLKQAGQAVSHTPRWFWPLLLLAVVVCMGMRLPLAGKSLWWDEGWQVMQASHGRWRTDSKQPDKMKFEEHDWKRAAWYYQKPTNHAPVSVMQKASQSVWRLFSGADHRAFSDLAARVPSLIGSALSVIWLACLLRAWGSPGAGIIAGLLLALHPWALRYGVDARGYALVLPMSIGALLAATRIVQSHGGSLLAWLGLALAEFVWMWAYPQAAFDLVALNGVLALLLFFKVEKALRWKTLARLMAANILAAALFIQAFLPNAMQALRWAGNETVSQPFSQGLLDSLFSHVVLGVASGWPAGVESAGLPASIPAAAPWGLSIGFIWAFLLLLGILWVFIPKRFPGFGKTPWLLLAVPLIGSALYTLVCVITEGYFYPRFVISIVPVLIALVCLIVAGLAKRQRLFAGLVGLSFAALILPTWYPQWKVSFERPIAPLHSVADYLDNKVKETSGQAIIACFGHGREIMPIYSPQIRLVNSMEELQALRQEARDAQRPLYIAYGHVQFNSGMLAEPMQVLRDPAQYREIAAFSGMESEFYYRVLEAL